MIRLKNFHPSLRIGTFISWLRQYIWPFDRNTLERDRVSCLELANTKNDRHYQA